jgi:arylsulfate sulfotransferase
MELTPISVKRLFVAGFMIAAGTALTNHAMATPVVTLTTSVPSPQILGTSVTLMGGATDTDPGILSFRFEIGASGSASSTMVRDYSVDPTFVFTPMLSEGSYQFVVVARNNSTLKTASQTITPYVFTPLVTRTKPVVVGTANPLVALFASPPCAAGGTYMRAGFLRVGAIYPTYTSWQPCVAGHNLNFVIAGMRATSLYAIFSETVEGTTIVPGTPVEFTTGVPTVALPSVSVTTSANASDSLLERFVLLAALAPNVPFAVDLSGSPVWYYPQITTPTRLIAGGTMLLIANGANSAGTSVQSQQVLREIDLAGNTVRETNATRISEQVVAMSGLSSSCQLGSTDCVSGAFHHEAIRLPNGHTLAMTDEERVFTDGTQGSSPTNPVDVMGDLWVDLDTNFQVVWYWRAFDHLNVNRAAILGETCAAPGGSAGCPPIFLTAGLANDWLHSNALYYTPSDGSVLQSMRHQDWIIKIDYNNGTGTKNILWTLGLGGNFAIFSSDPYPWFSHQHDPGFLLNGTTTLAMFDNGNTRVSPPPLGLGSGNSRGYVLYINQQTMVATPVLLADLGVFSSALGSAQLLANTDYAFDAGYVSVSPATADAIEVSSTGTLGYTLQVGSLSYRSFRLINLYSPPEKD